MMEQEKIKENEIEEENPKKYELDNGDRDLIGYISNELYYPIKKDKKTIIKETGGEKDGIQIQEIVFLLILKDIQWHL